MPGTTSQNWPVTFTQQIAANVRHHRQRQGLSVQALADRCTAAGLPTDRSKLAKLESGHRSTVTVPELLVLAHALDTPPLLLLASLDTDDSVEILPGVEAAPQEAVAWIDGTAPLPAAAHDEGAGPRAELKLVRDHQHLVSDWSTRTPRSRGRARPCRRRRRTVPGGVAGGCARPQRARPPRGREDRLPTRDHASARPALPGATSWTEPPRLAGVPVATAKNPTDMPLTCGDALLYVNLRAMERGLEASSSRGDVVDEDFGLHVEASAYLGGYARRTGRSTPRRHGSGSAHPAHDGLALSCRRRVERPEVLKPLIGAVRRVPSSGAESPSLAYQAPRDRRHLAGIEDERRAVVELVALHVVLTGLAGRRREPGITLPPLRTLMLGLGSAPCDGIEGSVVISEHIGFMMDADGRLPVGEEDRADQVGVRPNGFQQLDIDLRQVQPHRHDHE